MADEQQGIVIRNIDWREVFPFTQLFRAFRVAVHPSKLILALVALLAIYVGGRVLDGVWPKDSLPPAGYKLGMEEFGFAGLLSPANDGPRQGIFFTFFDHEVRCVNAV